MTVDVRPFGFNVLGDTSKAKQSGSTVPIKIQATDLNGANVSSSSLVVKAVGFAPASSPNSITPVEDSGKANPGGLFRLESDGYIFNWKLVDPTTGLGLPVGDYLFYFMIGDDPTLHSVTVSVKIGKR